MNAHTTDTTAADARLDALIARMNLLFGTPAAEPATADTGTRPDLFAFRDAMTAVEREVYGTR